MKLARTSILLAVLGLTACSTRDTASTADSANMAPSDVPAAPAAAAGEPTANDISNYKLDMDKMRKYATAVKNFAALAKSDSTVAAAMGETSANESMAELIAKLENSPIAMRELRKAGLSAKDYVWITAAYLQAAMTQGILESTPDAKMPEGQNQQNMEFLKANKVAIERMMKDTGM